MMSVKSKLMNSNSLTLDTINQQSNYSITSSLIFSSFLVTHLLTIIIKSFYCHNFRAKLKISL